MKFKKKTKAMFGCYLRPLAWQRSQPYSLQPQSPYGACKNLKKPTQLQ